MDIFLISLVGVCVFVFTWVTFNLYFAAKSTIILTDERQSEVKSPFFKILIPLARPLGDTIKSMFPRAIEKQSVLEISAEKKNFRQRLARQLVMAGSPEGLTPEEFIGLIFISAFFGLFIGVGFSYWLMFMFGPDYRVLIIPLSFAFGIGFPNIWLSGLIKKRHLEIRKSLPFALDLLTLTVEAGLDFTQALERILAKLGKTALAQEFNEMLHEIRMGKRRSDALRDTGKRAGVSELTSVLGALIQADELGTSLGPVLRIQSDMIRIKRSQATEKLAMEAPVKILFPLVCFIFPTTFIIILGPIFLKLFAK